MADLATISDVQDRLGHTITDPDEQTRINALLGDASATVRSYTGQQFTQATTTDRLKVRRGRARLPQHPIESVTVVADVNGNTLTHRWVGGQFVDIAIGVSDTWAWEPYRHGVSYVDITYAHGYDVVPADIIGVVTQLVMRTFGTDATAAGLVRENIGEYGYQVGTIAASGAAGLMGDERAVLDRHRRTAGVVYASP